MIGVRHGFAAGDNAHQHLTGDPLIRGCIPDLIDSDTSIYQWAVPLHAVHDETDDRLAATLESLRCLRSGTTSVIEAGTVGHPEAVAAGLADLEARRELPLAAAKARFGLK